MIPSIKSDSKILIVRPDAIGDVVLIAPMIRTLKAKLPNASIYTLQRNYTADLFKGHPDVSGIIIDKKTNGEAQGPAGFFSYVKLIKSYKFDAVIMPFLEPYYAALMKIAGIPIRIGDANKLLMRWMLTHPVPLNFRQLTAHEIELNIRLLSPLISVENPDSRMQLVWDNSLEASVKEKLKASGWTGKPLIAIHPTTGGGNRAWSEEKYVQLIDKIGSNGIYEVILTGAGEKDKLVAHRIGEAVKTRVLNLAGLTNLEELKVLINLCKLVIGTDTGPTHIAAAFSVPVLCISPTKFVKSLRWGPWGTVNAILGNPSICPYICNPYRCERPDCLDAIDVNNVVDKMSYLINFKGSMSLKQSKLGWLKASINIAVYCKTYDERLLAYHHTLKTCSYIHYFLTDSKQTKEQLEKQGLPTVFFKRSWRQKVKEINKHDINVIHLFHSKRNAWLWLRQLAALKQYCPPVIVDQVFPTNKEAVFDLYYQAFDRLSEQASLL